MIKRILFCFFILFCSTCSAFAKDSNKDIENRWINDQYAIEVKNNSITFKDLSNKSSAKWECEITDSTIKIGNLVKKDKNFNTYISPIYENSRIDYTLKGTEESAILILETYYETISLKKDTSLTTGQKLLLAGGIVAAVTTAAVIVDATTFSEAEFDSAINAGINEFCY